MRPGRKFDEHGHVVLRRETPSPKMSFRMQTMHSCTVSQEVEIAVIYQFAVMGCVSSRTEPRGWWS
jgi:hypothetical protein